ncbi:hypothetical protein HMPREF1991_02664 [Hoylesella loescheii DSM 19665 = JCM 12249 = ATCC 15930]|uniref:Uncharacterized protein n=1 Tax=Hoylesella loescheii DSM 19665 = JCM 12249 = ATCC 15930 TaxID=1122985 RepID=A0A069QES7_HOYLO|nr:hypothetical protein HMPREF1991_02664 [Hoylesella loescheii DSM 19665 = JCM 12249 = ATCC 15930]
MVDKAIAGVLLCFRFPVHRLSHPLFLAFVALFFVIWFVPDKLE